MRPSAASVIASVRSQLPLSSRATPPPPNAGIERAVGPVAQQRDAARIGSAADVRGHDRAARADGKRERGGRVRVAEMGGATPARPKPGSSDPSAR